MTLDLDETTSDFSKLPYNDGPYHYKRRKTRVVHIGDVALGGNNPIRVQSMTTADTLDTDSTVAEVVRLVKVGCEIVRITTPTAKDAENLKNIKEALKGKGIDVPLVADIHFNPNAAMEAAKWVEKIRINPGNFADAKRFAVRDYSGDEYKAELDRIEEKFTPLVLFCKEIGRSIRIGTNHGSLSDRIMNQFGDTPAGMVESALEFASVARKLDFHDLVFSMKASNPKVMIQAYRLLAARLDALGWDYPFHLGVTEAGNGEDGRIKSAIGIGSLLEDGIGDTIRVSLTEDPELEVPVAFRIARRYTPVDRKLLELAGISNEVVPVISTGATESNTSSGLVDTRNAFFYTRRTSQPVDLGNIKVGGENPVQVIGLLPDTLQPVSTIAKKKSVEAPTTPDLYQEKASILAGQNTVPYIAQPCDEVSASEALNGGAVGVRLNLNSTITPESLSVIVKEAAGKPLILVANALENNFDAVDNLLEVVKIYRNASHNNLVLGIKTGSANAALHSYRYLANRLNEAGWQYPVHLLSPHIPAQADTEDLQIDASIALGGLLADGIGDSVGIEYETGGFLNEGQQVQLSFNILQAAGARSTKAEFIACPSCGRTLFDLQTTTQRIKSKTGHLVGVKIAIMGCIVNGLGELADADFGYMGGAPGKVNLYVGKVCVEKGVPTEQADQRLLEIIKEHGRWVEPE